MWLSLNQRHPLSWLPWCSSVEHVIVFCHLVLPAREGSWHHTWGYKEPMCPHSGFHIPWRVWGESCFVIFLNSCHKWSLRVTPRSEQELLGLAGASSATCPLGNGGRGGRSPTQRHSGAVSGSSREDPLSGSSKGPGVQWKGSSDRKERKRLGRIWWVVIEAFCLLRPESTVVSRTFQLVRW